MGPNSGLHIIIFDEIDAICKTRGSVAGASGVHDTVVNQLLSKIDGVDQLNNILVIGKMFHKLCKRSNMIFKVLVCKTISHTLRGSKFSPRKVFSISNLNLVDRKLKKSRVV